MRIQDQRFGRLVDAERIELARLLVKAGYTVRIVKEKQGSKTVVIIEATLDSKEDAP